MRKPDWICGVMFLGLLTSHAACAGGVNFEEFVIEGEIQKPEITVVISRENLNKSYVVELKESFLDKILESLRKPPF
jgi:hypothetical protein